MTVSLTGTRHLISGLWFGGRAGTLVTAVAISATASVAEPAVPSSDAIWLAAAVAAFAAALLVVALFAVKSRLRKRAAFIPASTLLTADEVIRSARDAILLIKDSGEIIGSNPAAENLFGYSFSEIQRTTISTLIPPPAYGRRQSSYCLESLAERDLLGVRKSGTRFPLESVLSELSGRQPKCFSLIVRDRTNKDRAEKELAANLRVAADTLEHLPCLLVVVDRDGRLVRFNRACEELTQFSEGELRGQQIWNDLAVAPSASGPGALIPNIQSDQFPFRSQSAWVVRDHSARTISWTHNALRDDMGRLSYIVSTGTDVTVSVLSEERRREAESLQTAGRLAGGIAHDFNNLLTSITGYSGLALVNVNAHDSVRHDLEEIKRAGDRGAALTRQLLTFSGNQPRQAGRVDFNEAIRNVERLIRLMVPDSIRLDLAIEKNLPLALADRPSIEECVMQLVANAKEAMPLGGTLQIQTGTCQLNRTRVDAHPPLGSGDYITISVVDTGSGISPETLPHIFEPYFTTKDNPASHGMGLAMVYGIVRQAHGSIIVHSAPKFGSTFRILLPLAPDQAMLTRNEPIPEESLRGEETVLLAMDSDLDRERLRDVMEQAGYTVLDARSGLQALEIAHKFPSVIHLLVADIALPRLAGSALAESVRSRLPGIRTLFASAMSTDQLERQGIPAADVFPVSQTLDRQALLVRMRETLSSTSPC